MHSRARVWALLAVSYLTILETVHILWTGQATFSVESWLKMLLIPSAQMVVLMAFARPGRGWQASDERRIERFFSIWLVLSPTLYVANAVVELIAARRIDLTDGAVLLLLSVPTAQAAAVTLPPQAMRRLLERSQTVIANRAVRPIVWLDLMILAAGWALRDQPLVGMAVAEVFQRRWMGIKLIAAAVLTGRLAFRPQQLSAPPHRRRILIGAALLFTGLGLDGIRPWIYAFSGAYIYAPTLALLVTVALRARFAIACVDARSLFGAGAVVMFVAALGLAMNGFLSTQPVYPWAAIAMTAGSLAATLFLVGSVLAATSTQQTGRG